MQRTTTIQISRDDEDIDVVITGFYDHGEPEERYDANGTGNPGTPPGFVGMTARDRDGNRVRLTWREWEEAEGRLLRGPVTHH